MSDDQSPQRVLGEDAAEWLLSLVMSHARAAAIVGDLSEQAEGSAAWFWHWTLRVVAASAGQTLFSISPRKTEMTPVSYGFLGTLWKHKWLLVTCVLVSVVCTRIALKFYPAIYRSQTTILVVPQRVPDEYVHTPPTDGQLPDRLNTITQQILSRTRLERIVSEFDLYSDARAHEQMEGIVEQMRHDIGARVIRHDAFRITFDGSNPRVVQKVTERLASLFIAENLNDRATLADSTRQFLKAQLEDIRRLLGEKETAISMLKRSGRQVSTAESIEFDVLQQQYRDLLTKLQAANITANLERHQIGEQFKLLDVARIPDEPIAPNRKAATTGGAFGGLGLGVVLIGLTTRRRRLVVDDQNSMGS